MLQEASTETVSANNDEGNISPVIHWYDHISEGFNSDQTIFNKRMLKKELQSKVTLEVEAKKE